MVAEIWASVISPFVDQWVALIVFIAESFFIYFSHLFIMYVLYSDSERHCGGFYAL